VGADCVDDVDVVRVGGMKAVFDDVYAPQRAVALLPAAHEQVLVDLDLLVRPVYEPAKQGASHGHTKIAGKQVLRRGLSALVVTISTAASAPVIAGIRLRAGRAWSGTGAARMLAQAIATARRRTAGLPSSSC
jgi:hypothetical protein